MTAPAARGGEWLIHVEHVRKKFCRDFRKSLKYAIRDVGKALVLRPGDPQQLRPGEFWAVDDISFVLRRGESLGVIGSNGAGKSTLLKLITGQRAMTAGRVVTRGRIVALNELGLGFDPVLTGRENAYMNAAVLGLPRHKLDAVIDRIIEFSGVGEFIESAVGTYSSGMKARLAFAVVAQLEPDILIVDEVLAVGDLEFRRKCVEYVIGYLERGGSLVLVAHDPFLVQSICNRCIVLEHGRVAFEGTAIDGVRFHFEMGESNRLQDAVRKTEGPGQRPWEGDWVKGPVVRPAASGTQDGGVTAERFEVESEAEGGILVASACRVRLHCETREARPVGWGFTICTADLHTTIASCVYGLEGQSVELKAGRNVLECRIPSLPLRPGGYAIRGGVLDAKTLTPLALIGYGTPPAFFQVADKGTSRTANVQSITASLIELPVEWGGES